MSSKPKGSKWTEEQWQAIIEEKRPMLVAAAAGSGKTAVLVERIARKVIEKENRVELDQLLVVTFTNAAAAEMKQRIGRAIEEELSQSPDSLHLRKQLSLLQRANISTLHSFCMNVIRTYYYEIGIDPQFRMLDQTEAQLLEDEVVEEMIETAYREDPEFLELVDYFTGDRTDDQLKGLFLDLYHFSRAHPDPENWLHQIIEVYEPSSGQNFDDLPWVKEAVVLVQEKLKHAEERLAAASAKAHQPSGPFPYAEVLEEDRRKIGALLEQTNWSMLYTRIHGLQLENLPRISKKKYPDIDPVTQKEVQAVRKNVKEEIDNLITSFFAAESDLILDDMSQMAPVFKQLIHYVKKFAEQFQAAKLEKNSLDFSDLEHYCLDLLYEEKEPSNIALHYQQEFKEVMVDEYQDTNFVQEAILTMLSGNSRLFMVGDVKQSIYRFRLAEPGLFLEKYKKFQKDGEGTKIDLSKNFRSREEVIRSSNFIFNHIMSESFGELNYDEAAALKQGNFQFPESDQMAAEIMLVDKQEKEKEAEEMEELETAQLEARAVAARIRTMVDSKFLVYDKELGTERPVVYKDIVLLMRSMPWAETIMDEFRHYDIPIYADLSTGYFEAVEIRVMLSLLHAVDNPYQDIPLASVLRSPIFSLSEEKLAAIRLYAPEEYFYTALQLEAEDYPEGEGAAALTQLNQWRDAVRSKGLPEFIWQVYEESGYLEYLGGLPGGNQRRANLTSFYDRARTYESTSFRGLFRFLRFIERMQERGDDLGKAKAIGEQEDVVRLMTVHKSKGLEFPVVFAAGMNKQFNMMDVNKAYLKHKKLGFASRYIDPVNRVSYPTMYYHIVRERIRRESLAEEMRVLYVAMTRAEQKLILTGTVGELEDSLKKWGSSLPLPQVPESQLVQAKTFLDWIMPAVMTEDDLTALFHKESTEKSIFLQGETKWKFSVIPSVSLQVPSAAAPREEKEALLKLIKEGKPAGDTADWTELRFSWEYPFQEAARTRVKQSVTELKRFEQDPYAATNFQHAAAVFERPRFIQGNRYTAAEQGTVMHTVMQFISYHVFTEEEVKQELMRLIVEEKITGEDADQINIRWITSFLNSDLGETLRSAVRVERELSFTFPVAASSMYPDWNSEEEWMFVQGIIDCVYELEDGSLYILDYKTDRISRELDTDEKAAAFFKERYMFQISLYQQALESAWNRKVAGACLYMFERDLVINMLND